MSNAMRSGKRLLAGVAAGALGAGLLIGLGASSANAVTTSVVQPNAYRTGLAAGTLTVEARGTYANGANYILCRQAGAGTYTGATSVAIAGVGVTSVVLPVGQFNTAGSHTLAVYNDNNCPATLTPGLIERTFNVVVGGDIAAFTVTPASGLAPVGVAAPFTLTATDASARPTLPANGDSITIVQASAPTNGVLQVSLAGGAPAGAPVTLDTAAITAGPGNLRGGIPSIGLIGAAAQVPGATGAGNYQALFDALNLSVTDSTVSLTAGPLSVFPANATVTTATGPNVAEDADNSTAANRVYFARPAAARLTFTASNLTPGGFYQVGVANGGGPNNPQATANVAGVVASGEGTATIVVTADAAANNTTYTLTLTGAADTRTVTINYADPTPLLRTTPPNGGTTFAAAGAAVNVGIRVVDVYGNPYAGTTVFIRNAANTVVAQGTTGTDGALSLPVTAPATGSATFQVTGQTTGLINVGPSVINVSVATPAVSVVGGVSTPTTLVQRFVPAGATVNTGVGNEATQVTVSVTAAGAPVTGAAVTFTGTDGVRFSETAPEAAAAGFLPWNGGETTVTVASGVGVATVWAWSTKAGVNTITATAGGVSATGAFTAQTFAGAERNIAVTAPTEIKQGELGVVTLTVTDQFGNGVQGFFSLPLRFEDASVGTFGDGSRQLLISTDTQGRAQVTVRSSQTGKLAFIAGENNLSQFGAAANRLFANSATDNAPGFTASDAPKRVEVEVKAGTVERSITIAGARTMIGGRSGIEIDGVTNGFANGATVKPFFRFPGQTSYSEGSARPVITDGTFEWKRKTGKKFYAYVTSDDGGVKSNNVIIPVS